MAMNSNFVTQDGVHCRQEVMFREQKLRKAVVKVVPDIQLPQGEVVDHHLRTITLCGGDYGIVGITCAQLREAAASGRQYIDSVANYFHQNPKVMSVRINYFH